MFTVQNLLPRVTLFVILDFMVYHEILASENLCFSFHILRGSGQVYDVSSYLDEHPGGDDVLLAATGILLTLLLFSKCNNTVFTNQFSSALWHHII